jgi:hypothetical protein
MGNARSDSSAYREGYPDQEDPPLSEWRSNLDFYTGKIPSSPDGNYVDVIHETWKGQYQLLEQHHSYIQWLFPIREQGLNPVAQPLTIYEAEAIKADSEAMKRVVRSYRLLLDFYGMQLDDEATGAISRSSKGGSAEAAGNEYGYGVSEEEQKERYRLLNNSFHNYLRITRILKCLGELGLEHYKAPFLRHCLKEIFEGDRPLRNAEESCCDYWVAVLRNDAERAEIQAYVDEHKTNTDDLQLRRNIQMAGALGLVGGISDEYAVELEEDNRREREQAAAAATATTTTTTTTTTIGVAGSEGKEEKEEEEKKEETTDAVSEATAGDCKD